MPRRNASSTSPQTGRELTDGYFATIARRYGVPTFLMDDAIQEMKIRLWRAGPAVESFAGVVCGRAAIDFMRANGRRRGKQAAEVIVFSELKPEGVVEASSEEEERRLALMGAAGSDSEVDVHIQILDVKIALRRLPEREREIIRLYTLYGFSLREIGEQIGLSESRVQQLLRKSLEVVRELTAEAFDIGAERNGDI